MTELLTNPTIGQALLIFVGVQVLNSIYHETMFIVRRRRDRLTGDHCEHCGTVDTLDDQLRALVELARDQYAELEDIRKAVERIADETEAVQS